MISVSILTFIAGAVIAFLWMKARVSAIKTELQNQTEKAALGEEAVRRKEELETKLLLLEQADRNKEEQFRRELEFQSQTHAREMEQIQEQHRRTLEHQNRLGEEKLQTLEQAYKVEKNALEKAQETLQKQFADSRMEMEKSWKDKCTLLKEEFKTLSEKILEERSGALQNMNKEQLENLLNPLKEKMGEFRNAVEEAKNKGIEMNTAMKTQLEKMFDMTQKIGSEANHLATALRGSSKTQGNWGEMILEKILENSGLINGVHYEIQETIRHADGSIVKNENDKIMRPDVIVHYPDGKDVIIDSKVSLTAYTDYVNAENTDAVREEALTRHIRSVRAHVEELVRKNYSAYLRNSEREAVDFVIMFIPNEAPHQLAMMQEPGLWREAFEKKVLIVSPVNLMALLQMIHIAWTRADQERNQILILDTASQMLDRLYHFYDTFDEVGRKLSDASKSYQEAVGRLKGGDGRHSVVASGEKLRKLGVKMKKPRSLPRELELTDENGGECPP